MGNNGTDWKLLVEEAQARNNVLPKGWDSKETVAIALGIAQERVRLALGPAIRDGSVEVQNFPVWDPKARRTTRVSAYRRLTKTEIAARAKDAEGRTRRAGS